MAQFTKNEEVMASSSSVPRPVCDPPNTYLEFNPKATSERNESRLKSTQPSTDDTNKLSILLDDIEDVIRFAKLRFLKPRMIQLTNLKDNLDGNKSVIDVAESSLDALDVYIKVSMNSISSCVCEWNKRRQYYTQVLNMACDPANPLPDMKQCSKEIKQSYLEVVRKMAQLCCKIEKELRLAELKLSNMDELSIVIRKLIQQFRKKVDINSGKIGKLFNEQYVGVYCLLEKTEQNVNMLKNEWQKRAVQCNPTSPRLYTAQTQSKDNWTPPSCPRQGPEFRSTKGKDVQDQQHFRDAMPCPASRTTRGGTVNDTRSETQIDALASFPPRTNGNRSQAVKDIVGRYNDLQNTVRYEMENIKSQQQLIDKSEALEKQRATK